MKTDPVCGMDVKEDTQYDTLHGEKDVFLQPRLSAEVHQKPRAVPYRPKQAGRYRERRHEGCLKVQLTVLVISLEAPLKSGVFLFLVYYRRDNGERQRRRGGV